MAYQLKTAEEANAANQSNGIATYSGDGDDSSASRLTKFNYPDPESDRSRLSYIRVVDASNTMPTSLTGEGRMFSDINTSNLPNWTTSDDLATLRNQVLGEQSRYTKFMLTAHHVSRAERSQLMATFGDNYAVIFTGRQPQIASFSGNLVFDYRPERSVQSWYHAWINLYEFYLRASRLSKWWVKVRVEIPDLSSYEGYILSMNDSMDANTDNIIPFSFDMLVAQPAAALPMITTKANGASTISVSGAGGTSGESGTDAQSSDNSVNSDEAASSIAQANTSPSEVTPGDTKSPEVIGQEAAAANYRISMDNALSGINDPQKNARAINEIASNLDNSAKLFQQATKTNRFGVLNQTVKSASGWVLSSGVPLGKRISPDWLG